MKLATGRVVQGKVVADVGTLPDGMVVTVLTPDEEDGFETPTDLEAELEEAIAQAARGETMPIAKVLNRLRAL
ncbi:MAG: hypothetical protein ABI589_02795 [Burkholderiales bacterium]